MYFISNDLMSNLLYKRNSFHTYIILFFSYIIATISLAQLITLEAICEILKIDFSLNWCTYTLTYFIILYFGTYMMNSIFL